MKTPNEYKIEFAAGEKRFNRLLPLDADELTIVLKGHLLIEEQLRGITRSLVANPKYFDNARLTFSNVLHLARAVAGHLNQGACWTAAEKLNSIRNNMAHQVEPQASSILLEKLFVICEGESGWSSLRECPRDRFKLRSYIFFIWITFDALRAVVQVCTQAIQSPLTQRAHEDV